MYQQSNTVRTNSYPANFEEWKSLTHEIGKIFAERAQANNESDDFVESNYEELKAYGYFKALVPIEFGGAGLTHSQMCDIIRIIGNYCGSTALAMSMHQHLVSANVWKYKKGKGGEPTLRKVVDKGLILISTGAGDWLHSTGTVEKVDGGFLVSANKNFASQSAYADILATSAPYEHPTKGWQVLHFAVPITADGVTVKNNWKTMGMRGTGSHTVNFEKVFVADEAIALARPKGEYHPVWNIVLGVALPLIMAAYVGVAEAAAAKALEAARAQKDTNPLIPLMTGEMNNSLTAAQVLFRDMVRIGNDFDFAPDNEIGTEILTRKTLVANACKATVEKAMDLAGGRSFFRYFGMERLFRDIQASGFHPLPEKKQQQFVGETLLNG